VNINVVKAQAREQQARQESSRLLLMAVVAFVVAGCSLTMAMVFRAQRDAAKQECAR
jgi:heme/copper-type cytochrome/quinol oxidase subunit 2